MSLTLETKTLLKVVAQLGRIVPNKLLEITRYWSISTYEGGLSFVAHDGENWVRYSVPTDIKEDFNVMVKADQFGKLVEKTTVPNILLTDKGGYLEVKGNGTYKVEKVTEDEEFPLFDDFLPEESNPMDVSASTFHKIYNINSSAVFRAGFDTPMVNYLIDNDRAITTDSSRMCINPIEGIGDKILVPAELMKLLSALSEEGYSMEVIDGTYLYLYSDHVEVFGKLSDELEAYPNVDGIAGYNWPMSIELPVGELRKVIDRLSLFVGPFDKSALNLEFGKDKVIISAPSGSSEEIAYTEPIEDDPEYTIHLNSVLLKELLSAVTAETATVHLQHKGMIKIEAGGVTYFLALIRKP